MKRRPKRRPRRIFGGSYSKMMWNAIWKTKSSELVFDTLYLVCCRLQVLEERMEEYMRREKL